MGNGRQCEPPFRPVGQASGRKEDANNGMASCGRPQDRNERRRDPISDMISRRSHGLADLIQSIVSVAQPLERQKQLVGRLRRYEERLRAGKFQLAVLGQFKRGKSALLNAMIGHPLLATGILPLTAIPTFLNDGDRLGITLSYLDGRVEQKDMESFDELAAEIASATTEERNPRNERGLERVDVSIPSHPWLETATLIDTPGIGSTHAHNTETAEAVLPECDAALFVISADPPITEVEVGYLKMVRKTISRIVLVLNKADLLGEEDRKRAIAFLRSVLAEQAIMEVDSTIFPVAAQAALIARMGEDEEGIRKSGLASLEDHVREQLVGHKKRYLEAAVARNVSIVVQTLTADLEMARRALTLPLSELDEKIAIFESAIEGFAREQQSLNDLLSGEWRRTLSMLDEKSLEADKHLQAALQERLDHALDPDAAEEVQRSVIEAAMKELFDHEFTVLTKEVEKYIERTVAAHQARYDDLVRRVHETAASLMQVDVALPGEEHAFRANRQPYWTSRELSESLGAVTAEWLALLLPRPARQLRLSRKLRKAASAAVGRNIVGLNWAIHQNIDDTFRRRLALSQQTIEESIGGTRDLLARTRERRRTEDASVDTEVSRIDETIRELKERKEALAVFVADASTHERKATR